ncbi:11403_t:CDS:1 [Ambispora leptoticha]|uniref:11403_t:CDS:1 n=1 Tax=Ambispora leptoticha TaxID=144679 RepID=A0A9N9FJI1_9GLOM|nr:11403_t:CDS:1 [Ambispora leptoticha]
MKKPHNSVIIRAIFFLSLVTLLFYVTFVTSKAPDTEKNASGCPIEKCPYYAKIKAGEVSDTDWSISKCPLASKCPYYEELKKRALANGGNLDLSSDDSGCPYVKKCPHFKDKDGKVDCGEDCLKEYYKAHGHGEGKGDLSKCPYLSKAGADGQGSKCPYLEKLKEAESKEKTGKESSDREEL